MTMDPMLIGDANTFPGVDKARPRLISWLNKIVDSLEQEAAINLTLAQVTSLAGEKSVAELTHDLDAPVPETVEEILNAAIDDMDTGRFLTRVSYTVRVDGREDRINFPLEMTRRRGTSDEHRRDYFPDVQGLTAQSMEMVLDLHDRLMDQSTANVEDKNVTIADLREENRLLKMNEWELRRQIERLMSADLKRRMMVKEFDNDQRRKDQNAETFQQLLPVGVSVALGPQAGAMVAQVQAMMRGTTGGGRPGETGPSGGTGGTRRDANANGTDGADGDTVLVDDELTDSESIDRFVAILERRADLFQSLLQLLGQEQEAVALLLGMHARSMARRQEPASPASPGPRNASARNGSRRGTS